MSKVLFVMKYPLEEDYSVKGKFNGQMNAARELGHDVYFMAYDHNGVYLIHGNEQKMIKRIKFGNSKHYIHTKAFFDLYYGVIQALQTEHFDMAYVRHAPLSLIGALMCLKLQKSGCKIIVEIPTYPPEKEKQTTLLRTLYIKYSSFCWRIASRFISLYALIGETADSYNGVPAINIDNGIDVDSVSNRHPCYDDKRVHLLAVASMSVWHGYDRIITSIAALSNEDKDHIIFDMVGGEGDGSLNKWKQMVKDLGVEKQVVFHGRRTGEALDQFYEGADIGICSLGMYRIGFESGSILKLREYTARGLPFVYAANDPALPSEQEFCMKVPNDNTPIDVKQLIEFALALREKPDIPAVMRGYAKQIMSWEGQMRKVFDSLHD